MCRKCGVEFEIRDGGGFVFHLLHCDTCGVEKAVMHEDLGDVFRGYIKGLDVPYAIATAGRDEHIRQTYEGPAVSAADFNAGVEKAAGTCKCGGTFKLEATARCPNCRSMEYDEAPGSSMAFYD